MISPDNSRCQHWQACHLLRESQLLFLTDQPTHRWLGTTGKSNSSLRSFYDAITTYEANVKYIVLPRIRQEKKKTNETLIHCEHDWGNWAFYVFSVTSIIILPLRMFFVNTIQYLFFFLIDISIQKQNLTHILNYHCSLTPDFLSYLDH